MLLGMIFQESEKDEAGKNSWYRMVYVAAPVEGCQRESQKVNEEKLKLPHESLKTRSTRRK